MGVWFNNTSSKKLTGLRIGRITTSKFFNLLVSIICDNSVWVEIMAQIFLLALSALKWWVILFYTIWVNDKTENIQS